MYIYENSWYVETSHFSVLVLVQFSLLSSDNSVFMVWLGWGPKTYLVRVWKTSRFWLEIPVCVLFSWDSMIPVKNIQWFHTYRCWNVVWNCGHWLGSPLGVTYFDILVLQMIYLDNRLAWSPHFSFSAMISLTFVVLSRMSMEVSVDLLWISIKTFTSTSGWTGTTLVTP